jgi:hypothetical protein
LRCWESPGVGGPTPGFFLWGEREGLKVGGEAGLFADFVGGDAVEKFMAFYGDGLEVVGIDGMIGALPEQVKAVFLQVAD